MKPAISTSNKSVYGPDRYRVFLRPYRDWDKAWEDDFCVSSTCAIAEAPITAYAELKGEFTPVHRDKEYATTTPFGTRVAHGLLGLSIAEGLKMQSEYGFVSGMSIGWTWNFLRPIMIDDSVHMRFAVAGRRA